mmetsp:Transcript_85196/g.241423  ORF Transcript_85196/g.241423 Transcript_85196/m.241423 type:complete len:131 (+) Transcript_85196:74-466(+)
MLEDGADPDGPSTDHPAGWSALHVAATHCHTDVVKLLLAHGALTTTCSSAKFGSTPAGSTAQDALEREKARVMLNNPDHPRSIRRTEELIDRFDATIAAFIILPPEPTFTKSRKPKSKRKLRRSLASWFK